METIAHFVDLPLRARTKTAVIRIPIDFTRSIESRVSGYIAGTGDGIVTINGRPARREIWCMDASNYVWLRRAWSLTNGHYLITGLDPNKRYLVMSRDLPPNGVDQRYEPFAWDYVEPATDLTLGEQKALWASWQT